MQREIGSNFWIDPHIAYGGGTDVTPSMFGIEGSDRAWTSCGRGASLLALASVCERGRDGSRTVLVPAFTCDTVPEPFEKQGWRVASYPVDEKLFTTPDMLLEAAEKSGASVAVLHRYFGFDTLPDGAEAVRELRRRGVTVIEDRTQCLYSETEPLDADYTVASIRKWCGVPDGGFAVCREGTLCGKPGTHNAALEQAKKEAAYAKYRWMFENIGEKTDFLAMYRDAEEILDGQTVAYAASPLSLAMQAALDTDTLRRKRRENFSVLLDGVKGLSGLRAVFPALPDGVVPLYFPLWVEGDRAALQGYLRQADVFAPIVWPKGETMPPVCEAADGFYEQLLCIPVDQRYDCDDMERVVTLLRSR